MRIVQFLGTVALSGFAVAASAKTVPGSLFADLVALADTPAVPGYENALAQRLLAQTAAFHPQRDALGDILITVGSGAPHRVLAAPMDEPGFVVSAITADGYLRVQRLPQFGLPPHYDGMQNAQPVSVETRSGKLLPGVVAALSIHLQPGRRNAPDPDDPDNMYIDLGARTKADAERAGVDLLSPIAIARHLFPVGDSDWSGTAVGDRFGDAVLLDALRHLDPHALEGTVTFAFVAQQWTGARGLSRVLTATHPDELLYVGRALPSRSGAPTAAPKPGSGVLAADASALPADLRKAAAVANIRVAQDNAASLIPQGFGNPVPLPSRSAHLAVPLAWPLTAAETLDGRDLAHLSQLVQAWLQESARTEPLPGAQWITLPDTPVKPTIAPSVESVLRSLILTYGVSEHEAAVRRAVRALLPPWAKPVEDAGGNLVLELRGSSRANGVVLIAHMDEIGYRVRAILADGTLALENKGGGMAAFYWGHPALVHTAGGARAGVIALPENYASPDFHFPSDIRAPATMYVGASNPDEVARLGIRVGDTVTIPKSFQTLEDGRVSGRSLDDRVGCAALIRAAWLLGPRFDRNVTFVWSTREELGLFGAAAYAKETAASGDVPRTVFAIDTFVSSDSPLESQRFADGLVGRGFVIRAIDNSNIAPPADVWRLKEMADAAGIPVQYGVTGGGNDGAAFLRYGAVDVALGWPLRYAHSPAELIALSDVDALADIATLISRSW